MGPMVRGSMTTFFRGGPPFPEPPPPAASSAYRLDISAMLGCTGSNPLGICSCLCFQSHITINGLEVGSIKVEEFKAFLIGINIMVDASYRHKMSD